MFKREFKINLKSLILWTIITLAIFTLVYLIYPSLINEESKQILDQLMNTMSKEMLASFNMDIVGIESAYGWFKTEGYTIMVLLGSIYSALLGGTILLKEENDKTIEFLYSKPVSRNNIVTKKIFCGIINILIFTLILTLGNLLMLSSINGFNLKEFLMISILPILLYYMMFFIMLFISTFMRKTRKTMIIGIGFVFIEYFMQIIGNMGSSVKLIKNVSLFEFISSRNIILNNSTDIKYIVLGITIIIVTTIGTYIKYNKKEFIS